MVNISELLPFRSGCRAGTCAPPLHCLDAAAHGWPPYVRKNRIRPGLMIRRARPAGPPRASAPTRDAVRIRPRWAIHGKRSAGPPRTPTPASGAVRIRLKMAIHRVRSAGSSRTPTPTKPASQSLRSKSIKSVFPATCAAEKLPRAQLMQAPRAEQAGLGPRAISASISIERPAKPVFLLTKKGGPFSGPPVQGFGIG